MGIQIDRAGESQAMVDPTALGVALFAALLVMTVVWALHLGEEDASIVDPVWAPAIVLTALAYAGFLGRWPTGGRVVFLLVPLAWAARLSLYLAARHAHEGEDRRYRRMREARGDAWWWQSLYAVFWLQGGLATLVALPLMGLMTAGGDPGLLAWLGALLTLAGFFYEALADGQLARFKRSEATRVGDPVEGHGSTPGGVLESGLWRFSRHPNYFGEAVLWWGIGVTSWGLGAPFGLFGSVVITVLLLKVSGVALTESDIASRRPEYVAYARRTNAFLPGKPRTTD